MAGTVEKAIRARLTSGTTLLTHGQSAPFVLSEINDSGTVLLLGAKRARTPLRWDCLEGITEFLRDKGWVHVGSTYNVIGDPQTLDGYLKTCIKRATGNWVARVLGEANVVDVDPGPPIRVRLRPGR